jgi:phosphoenolpyruvate-protein phosphotransferase/dihydroxyacetone kinase phosphotransfer subunit
MTADVGVGLVVVSHSRALARAAVALASEMLHGRTVQIEIAAGLDETTFGTDAVQIKDAIELVDGPAGVVVLMDLGSAVLSAELALDLLADPAMRDRVILSAAPIVEGLIVAAVAAAGGASRAEVAAEARSALLGKAAHFAPPGPAGDVAADEAPSEEIVAVLTVANAHGLHARPAARLVSEVRGLDAVVRLRNLTTGAGPVPAGSLSRVATLGALQGHQVEVRASGPQAQEAVEHLVTLAKRRFDEPVEPVEPVVATASAATQSASGPQPGAPGVAIGPIRWLTIPAPDPRPVDVDDPAAEWRRIVESIADVRRDIEHVRVLTLREVGADEASIFDAHLALLADAELLADVKQRISEGDGAAAAWLTCITAVERQWADLADPYLRERALDIRAVGEQVLRAVTGASRPEISGVGVLVARDLTPADAAALDLDAVTGVVLAYGSASSHAAILARARDIPLVVAAGREVLTAPEGTVIVIDGTAGELHIDPTAELLAEFQTRQSDLAALRAEHLGRAGESVVTNDGTAFVVMANLGSVADARAATAAGADGAGLVRTEFLFLGRSTPPDLDEQQATYDAIAGAMAGRRITLRTLDVGGDKPLAYLPVPPEQNPFLGMRGIRLSLDRRDLLVEQLTAICRTARLSPTSVMFPMVTTLGELLEARQALTDAAGSAGLPAGLRVGMMVEVPAAALKIESFLPHLDFVSIGTNDLTQYTLAAERGNGSVAAISDALDPGVLQLVDRVCRAAEGRVEVAVCGEAASDELALPVLVGLGVRELSVSPHAVPRVKAGLRELDVASCRALARHALTLSSADDVRKSALTMLSDTNQGD